MIIIIIIHYYLFVDDKDSREKRRFTEERDISLFLCGWFVFLYFVVLCICLDGKK